MKLELSTRSRTAVAAAAALLAVGAAARATRAAIPAAEGTIAACYQKNSGDLRVVDAEGGETCRPSEVALSWKDGEGGKVADADLLDGIDSTSLVLHCPSGYTRSRDVCYSPRRTGTFSNAWFFCLNSGGRLPDSAELAQVFPALVVPGGVPAEEDWTTDMTAADRAIAVSVSGFTVWWTDRAMSDSTGYRCILSPTNDGTPAPSTVTAGAAAVSAEGGAPRRGRRALFAPAH